MPAKRCALASWKVNPPVGVGRLQLVLLTVLATSAVVRAAGFAGLIVNARFLSVVPFHTIRVVHVPVNVAAGCPATLSEAKAQYDPAVDTGENVEVV